MPRPASQTSRVRLALAGALGLLAVSLVIGVGHAPGGARHGDDADARGPLDLRSMSMHQHRLGLTLGVRTAGEWGPGTLDPNPTIGSESDAYLCLELLQDDKRDRWCLARGSEKTRMFGGRLNDAGEVLDRKRLGGARIRHRDNRLTVKFPALNAGLEIGAYRWRLASGWGDDSCTPPILLPPPPQPCTDRAPDDGYFRAKLRRPRIVGCTRDEHMFNTHGSTRGKRMALTFDDGPSSYTGRVLNILRDHGVHSTFFEIGQEIPGHGDVMRQIIASRDELGNHSLHHEESGASAASLRETNDRIRAATGFKPCLYRPPGGYISASTSRAAWSQGMSNIIWDVDPRDWENPGSGAIYSRVVGAAHPGAIVVMHDGGGDRSQTVAALPNIISTLKSRGYKLVTVTRLLNERFRWKP